MSHEITPHLSTLDNGMRVVVAPMEHARSVSISFYLAAGSRYETDPVDAGLSHFAEHLCFKGTSRRPRPQDISIEIDAIGGTINAATNRELTVYYAKVTPEHTERAMDVLADMLRGSLYLEPEIERERGVILEELAGVEDSPGELVSVALDRLIWPGQPHGRDIAGTPESVAAITSRQLVDYYREQYVANATVLSIAGAITPEAGLELAERFAGDWRPGEPREWHRDRPAEAPTFEVIEKDTEQAHLALGLRALSASDEDRYALNLLSIILGEGMSSRLFVRLREELGLCYDIHTYVAHLRDTGMFGVYAGVDPDHAVETIREIARELRGALEAVTAEELERAKAVARSRVQLRMEDSRSVSAQYGSQAILDLPLRTAEESISRSEAVTIEDVRRVAGRVLSREAIRLAVVGPFEDGADIEAALDAFEA